MTDKIDQSRRVLAGTVEKHDEQAEEVRRHAVNLYAAQQGLIDEGEDLFNDWEDAHNHDLRSVQSYVDGNRKDWEGAKEAIDDIADPKYTRRHVLGALGLGAATTAAGAGVMAATLNDSGSDTGTLEANVSNTGEIGSYLEDAVIGNEMLEQEWGSLLANYDAESNEFFPDEDINLESIDVVYDDSPGGNSGYRTTADLNGRSQKSDWIYFEHDETAKNALEHFGEL